MTPQQQEEIHLSGIALESARVDLYNCEQRRTALAAELEVTRQEHERLGRVVERAQIALSKAKRAAKKKGTKGNNSHPTSYDAIYPPLTGLSCVSGHDCNVASLDST